MNETAYKKLAKVLDTLPNGFPATENGLEIKLLKRIFDPDEAELFCDLKLTFETAQQIAERTGRPLEGLEEKLEKMANRGQITSVQIGDMKIYRMIPWIIGIYEKQLSRLDREFVKMLQEYHPIYNKQHFSEKPQPYQIIPIEEVIPANQESLPYERVSKIIESSQSFYVKECICKKEKRIIDEGCDRPLEVCMVLAPIPGMFDNLPDFRLISKNEAKEVLRKAEDAALVHLTSNTATGQYYICNCCGCCCSFLNSINKLDIPAGNVVNSHYYAEITKDLCSACGICADERCQVHAIGVEDGTYSIKRDRCIGCGLCASACPQEAIQLVRKQPEEIYKPPLDQMNWFDERARQRGVDISPYK